MKQEKKVDLEVFKLKWAEYPIILRVFAYPLKHLIREWFCIGFTHGIYFYEGVRMDKFKSKMTIKNISNNLIKYVKLGSFIKE